MSNTGQVFQTSNKLRWRSVKWSVRVILAVALFVIAVVVVTIVRGISPDLPNIETKNRLFEDLINTRHLAGLSSPDNKKYKGFKSFLAEKEREDSLNKTGNQRRAGDVPFIRAAFFAPADNYASGLADLQQNADKLNTIFPQWFFIDSKDHTVLNTTIDSAGLAIMKQHHLRIIPILSNVNRLNHQFEGGLLHDILNEPLKRKKFISNLADTLLTKGFNGINIDFEELQAILQIRCQKMAVDC